MVAFFKSNNPSVVIFYVFYLVLFRIFFAFGTVESNFVFEHQEPLSVLLFGSLKNLFINYQMLSIALGTILCFVQALLINGIVNENKILAKKNYLPGAMFIIFASFFKEFLLLTPASVALLFLIICTARMFALLKKEKSYGDVFDLGFLVAVAMLFYFPSVLFVLFAYIGLATMRPFNYREWTIVLLGFISPVILVFTFYFWNDKADVLLAQVANAHQGNWLVGITLNMADKILVGGITLCTIACLVLLPASLYSSLIQVRKFATSLVVFLALVLVAIVLEQNIRLSHLILMALPLGIFSSMALMQIKRKWLSEVIHIILILFVLAAQYF